MVIMAGIGGIRIMYFTHALYPLVQSLQHSDESDAFIILNIQMRLQMQRLRELPKLTKLLTRRLELIPHLSDSKPSPLPILQYSLLSLCFFFFFQQSACSATMLAISYSLFSHVFWTQTHYFSKALCHPPCAILNPAPFLCANPQWGFS